jgi:hypothetical protein
MSTEPEVISDIEQSAQMNVFTLSLAMKVSTSSLDCIPKNEPIAMFLFAMSQYLPSSLEKKDFGKSVHTTKEWG